MSDTNPASLYTLAGGAAGLDAVLRTFYDAVFVDPMIGFLFVSADKERLIAMEREFASVMLGARDLRYSGRPMGAAHASHPILGGHFERRAELLRQAMAVHGVPDEVRRVWLDHTERLRPLITRGAGSGCDHPPAAKTGLEIEYVEGGPAATRP